VLAQQEKRGEGSHSHITNGIDRESRDTSATTGSKQKLKRRKRESERLGQKLRTEPLKKEGEKACSFFKT